MEFVKKLRSRSLKKTLLPVILLLVLAVLFLAVSEFWLLFQKPANLYEVPRDQLKGKYVTAEITYIYGEYAYTENYKNGRSTGEITSIECIIDANSDDFCGLYLPGKLVERGEALAEESDAYYNYETDEITTSFTVRGIMKEMPQDSLSYYHEYVDYDTLSADQQQWFLPLYLEAWEGVPGDMVSMTVLGLACLVFALVLLCKALSGGNQKQLLQKAEQLAPGNPEYVLAHAEQLYDLAPSVGGLRMNASLILVEEGKKQYLYSTKELVWAYQQAVRQRVYGIAVGTRNMLVLRMSDKSARNVVLPESQIREQLQKIQALVPGCAIGYSDQLEELYRKNMAELKNVAAAQRAPKAPAQADAPEAEAEPQTEAPVPAAEPVPAAPETDPAAQPVPAAPETAPRDGEPSAE